MSYLDTLLQGVEVEWKTLGEVTNVLRGRRLTREQLSSDKKFPVFHGGLEPLGYYEQKNRPANSVMIINVGASAGTVGYSDVDFWSSDGCYSIEHSEKLNNKFLYYFLIGEQHFLQSRVRKAGIPTLDAQVIEKIPIPILCKDDTEKSLEIQKEIVRILDTFTELTAELSMELTAELTARKKQFTYHREQLLSFDEGEVEWKTLGEVCDVFTGGEAPLNSIKGDKPNDIYRFPIYGNGSEIYGYTDTYRIDKDAVTISSIGANTGTIYFRNAFFTPIIRLKVVIPKYQGLLPRYLFHYLNSITISSKSSSVPNMNAADVKKIEIPIPSPAEQEHIVYILDKFDILRSSISEGLPKEIELRKMQYEYYRDLLLTFPNNNIES